MTDNNNITNRTTSHIDYSSSPQIGQSTRLPEEAIPARLEAISAERRRLMSEEGALLEKGLQSMDIDVLMKANAHWHDVQQRESSGIKSTIVDPNEFNDAAGYKSKSFNLSYQLLRRMAQAPVIRSVITTRQAQIAAFASPQTGRFDTGFVIRKKRDFYTTEEPKINAADKKEIKRITEFLINCGDESNKWHGDNFDKFLKKLTEDALVLDQATFEVVRNLRGEPVEFLATDGGTFRIASTYDDDDAYKNSGRGKDIKMGYYPSYVQLIDGEVVNEYYPWELCFGLRNDSTDIRRNGYGRSELEDLIDIVTYMLYGDAYNGKFFSQGSSPKGLIKVSGNVNSNRLQEFKQQWLSMVSGVMNAWKIPVIESDKMEWIDLQKSNTDMQFGTWQEYLIKITCAVYKISPEEIGFASGSGGGSSMFEGSNTEARLKYSRDKGLRPLLKSIQFWINRYLVNPLNEEFEFVFMGMETDSRKEELDLDIKMVTNFGGWKEARRKWGLPDELEEGDFPLNQIFFQKMTQDQAAEQQGDSTDFVDQQEDQQEDPYAGAWDNLDKGELSENPMMNDLNSFWKSL